MEAYWENMLSYKGFDGRGYLQEWRARFIEVYFSSQKCMRECTPDEERDRGVIDRHFCGRDFKLLKNVP